MIKVLNGGIEIVVEDWPGRVGYMGLGMSPSGALDNLALQLGNIIVGNDPGEAGIEITAGYCSFEFTEDRVICLTGTDMSATVNGKPVPVWEAFKVYEGDQLQFGHFADQGFRAYILIAGGIDVPLYLESKSTCLFGAYGGFEGRKLKPGDELMGGEVADQDALIGRKLNPQYMPEYKNTWDVRLIVGPASVPDYVTEEGMDYLFSHEHKVRHDSNRSGYRLEELPSFFFARENGGEGGDHPSNWIESGYNMLGAVNINGNFPTLLIGDGPTFGGLMCSANIIYADLWKIGQTIPGRDKIRFIQTTQEEAKKARIQQLQMLKKPDLVM
ncbi:MAG: biotin-dependent carboxyltransferase family protein [Clostridia bacterium]|nr:biotin-dependent carboxyltransferase family protein [Clostridia bacterium]